MLALALSAALWTGSGGLLADGPVPGARLLEPSALELSLRSELDRLESSRPALGWPVTLTASGGALFLGGLGMLLAGGVTIPSNPALFDALPGARLAVAGLICMGAGALLVLLTGEWLGRVVAQRRSIDAQASGVRRELLAAERARTPPEAPADLPADAPTRARLTAPLPLR